MRYRSLLSLMLLLAACGSKDKAAGPASGPASTATRQVVVYSPHGQEILDDYEKRFEKAHPEIDFVGRFIPTGQILSQLRIDKSAPQVDVWWGGTSSFFNQAAQENLLASYKPTWAQASKPGQHDPQDRWYAQFLQVPAFMFNREIYKADQVPGKWADLLDPKWKGKIVIREPMDSGTMKTILSGIAWGLGGANHDSAPGYEFLKNLDAQTGKYVASPQVLYEQVARSKEGYISLWNVTDIVFQAEANHYPFGFKIPTDRVPVSVDPIGLIAGAPHPEEAKLFYEFATSRESCIDLARRHYRILARTDIGPEELGPELSDIRYAPLEMDLGEFDKLQGEWMEHWQKSIRDPNK